MSRFLAFALSVIAATPAFGHPVTIRSCDREITFESSPVAAVSNDVNITEMMLVLGLEDRMVGYSDIPDFEALLPEVQEAAASIPRLSPDLATKELIVGSGADFYFAGWNYGLTVGGEVTPQSLGRFGIKVYELTESCIHLGSRPDISLSTMYVDLLNLGRIFGVEEKAEELVANYQEELREVLDTLPAATEPLRVFVYDSGEEIPFTAGRYAMPTALIKAAGGVNIMDDLEKSWTVVGWEAVVERNPEIVVIVNYGEVTAEQKKQFMMSHPAFEDIDAVQNERFVVLQYDEATPGPRNIDAVKKLAKAFWGR